MQSRAQTLFRSDLRRYNRLMTQKLYYEPAGFTSALPGALPLGGSRTTRFTTAICCRRSASGVEREILSAEELPSEVKAALTKPRPDLAGVSMTRPSIMGIVNVTPDSFSDGGDRFDSGRAVADGLAMWSAGADFIDVGGESTRPGSEPPTLEEELRRVVPVVKGLASQGVRVSVDTRRAAVMAEAASAGAAIINDISALTSEPEALSVAAESGLPVILMHMRGEPRTMQVAPRYDDVVLDVYDYLAQRIEACQEAGIALSRLCVDPGVGFGKTAAHNVELVARLAVFHGLGCPLLLGVSRKSFIGKFSQGESPKDRVAGTLAVTLAGVLRGAQIHRVHDVQEALQGLALWRAVEDAGMERPAPATPRAEDE